jgi:uncharacterized membrane protein
MLKDLTELVNENLISQETADKIQAYYNSKVRQSKNVLFVVFGILGAMLVGLGIILIIAHNWDELSRSSKTIMAFLPLIIGQGLCIYTLVRKKDSVAWRESASTFLVFAVGACISLVSQVYHIPGDLADFLLTWSILSLPLIYVMNSSLASLLFLTGITYYAAEAGYWSHPTSEAFYYWLLLLLAMPFYFALRRKKPESNFTVFHDWLVPLSVIISLGIVAKRQEEWMFVAYMSLFGIIYLLGNSRYLKNKKQNVNPYLILGSLGTLSLLMGLSFDVFWKDLRRESFYFTEIFLSPEFIASATLTLVATALLFFQFWRKSLKDSDPMNFIFMVFLIIFIIGISLPVAVVLINLLIFAVGLLIIRNGAKRNHLGILNYGLLLIMVLVICRFFDTDLSFIARGLLFVSVGIGFFVANYLMLKKRKQDPTAN